MMTSIIMSVSAETTLLAMCEAAPEDDEPRLVWADHAGGERGELVTVQCALARGGLSPARSGALRIRQHELLAANGRAWSGLAPWAQQCRYRRGFVELARFPAATFLAHAEQIFAAAPLLTSVRLYDMTDPQLAALIEHPMYGQLRGLGLPSLGEDALTAAIGAGAFAKLEALALGNPTPAVVRRLAESGALQALTRMEISCYADTDLDMLPELLAATPALRALDLSIGDRAFELVDAIPLGVTALRVSAGDLQALEYLPRAGRIEQLALALNAPGETTLPSFEAFPRLRSLDVLGAPPRALVEACARGELGTLRELRATDVTAEPGAAISEALGDRLEIFEVALTPDTSALVARTAGVVIASPWRPWPAPMFAGELANAPMWDYPLREANGHMSNFMTPDQASVPGTRFAMKPDGS